MGLAIKATLNEKPDKELQLIDIGLISSRGDDEFQPFMVGFFKGQEVSLNFSVNQICKFLF